MSIQAYQRAATQAETPRDLEYRAFAHVTSRLIKAKEGGAFALGALSEALSENRRLWTELALDCSSPQNQLGAPLRAQIISLALFVERHSIAVIRDDAEIEPLIDINRSIMEGLARR